ncbi:MAG: hypothetical protein ABR906_13865, partial [Terracidiphilus sp.]
MKQVIPIRTLFPSRLAVLLLASAVAIPAIAQQGQTATAQQNTPPATIEEQPTSMNTPSSSSNAPKEGFWGRVNPFARKKWVNNRVDPLKDQLGELDEVNAKNSRQIQDMDQRAQAGIRSAQSSADAANQTATTAGSQARKAGSIAQGAASHVDQLNSTVTGLD